MTMGKVGKKAVKKEENVLTPAAEVKVEKKEAAAAVAEEKGKKKKRKQKKKDKSETGNKENSPQKAETEKPTPVDPVAPVVPRTPKDVQTVKKCAVENCVKALYQLLKQDTREEKKNKLFDEGASKLFLQVSAIKLPADSDKYIVKARLPQRFLAPDADVLLIVKDIERGTKADHDGTLIHYQTLLKTAGVNSVAEIMPLRQLRVEYKEFEAKHQLSKRFDKVLVDDRIIRLIPQFLGSPFYKKRKFPVAVNLKKKELVQEICRCINTSQMPLNNHGSSNSLAVGHVQMEENSIIENIEAALRVLEQKYPGGWKNVRSVHLYSDNTSLPLYITDRRTEEVGKVESVNARRSVKKVVVDELSTIPGATVLVTPTGTVRVKRVADPEWDKKVELREEPKKKMKKSEQQEDQEEDKEEDEEEDFVVPKAKKEDKKAEKEVKNKKEKKEKNTKGKDKKGKEAEESESEDDMEDMEMEYMRKVAEEEEEIERKEKENMEKMGQPVPAAEEEDDDDASEADDDIEAENLLSEDEEDGEEDSLIMPTVNDGELDEEEAEEAPKKSKKSKKAKKSAAKGTPDHKKKDKKAGLKQKSTKTGKVKDGKIKKKK